MSTEQSTVTTKHQATIPRRVRAALGITPGERVRWHVVHGRVLVDAKKKIKHPARFLTQQTDLSIDAVKLVRAARDELV